ncbi:lipid-A-disaccharide synthase N-terminal domain-containing protein [Cohnella zeiphila]|uniref:Lipid-A-disaccharide synthase N-terminal domain-containing protein n=1 Tax=Cohnella zeiphila TaxID=2761120 RepID=A0A7X0SH88_9BACL|nr:lipid-A-disaccharide synthase N-terminal domain-containing protein [Cohnella zeiphila]MBB6729950.1 lipid-A-disaccharide synthase N-terminal domain-containing protein [Cohnella zeiphila]
MWAQLTGHLTVRELLWIVFGMIGQVMFTGRFVIQWIASERAKKSVVTRSFWLFSILGSSMLSVYAIYRRDPVFIIGQTPGIFIYFRNLVIMRNEEKRRAEPAAETSAPPAAGAVPLPKEEA